MQQQLRSDLRTERVGSTRINMTMLLEWQMKVNAILISSTRPAVKSSVLNEAEFEEMVDAFKGGKSPEDFAAVIQERDRDRLKDEPLDHTWLKPLSADDEQLVSLLMDKNRYVGVNRQIEKVRDDDEAVVLRIPRIRRVFAERAL